jgi:hypothetical protein
MHTKIYPFPALQIFAFMESVKQASEYMVGTLTLTLPQILLYRFLPYRQFS